MSSSLAMSVVCAVIAPNSTWRFSISQKRWLGMPAKLMAVGRNDSASSSGAGPGEPALTEAHARRGDVDGEPVEPALRVASRPTSTVWSAPGAVAQEN